MSTYRRPSIFSKDGDILFMDECCGDSKFILCEAACTAGDTSCVIDSTTYNSGDTIATGDCYIQKCVSGTVTSTTTCPADYTKLTFDGKEGCFNYGADAKSWADAETYCTGKSGGNLAVISSEAE